MKLGARIFFCFLLVFFVCFSYPIHWVIENLRTRYMESVEEPLVDQANILAALVGKQMEAGTFDPKNLKTAFDEVYSRNFSARIHGFEKQNVDMRVYITDNEGFVMFDSRNEDLVGEDYSAWRDVILTLDGKYGARTTRNDPKDDKSSELFVAAPIVANTRIAGVLTVAKPTANINAFINDATPEILKVGIASLAAAVLLSLLVSIWVTRPIKRLTVYADEIREGRRVSFPRLDKTEIGDMGKSFEKMREALEGKKYVEQYVQQLTHEIKSPLSAIRGAAELLHENMEASQRDRFLSNILNEANRIQEMIDSMLDLSVIEGQKNLQKIEPVDMAGLVNTIVEANESILAQKKISIAISGLTDVKVKGDPFLLHQAVSNLVQNAVDFSPENSRIEICGQIDGRRFKFCVKDEGSGIPDYAVNKVFEKFFSLQRPGTGKKSTGLGLNFVKEVAVLHNGDIRLENRQEKGLCATLTIPV